MRLEVHASCFGSFQNKMCLLLDLVLPGATCSSQGGPGTERTESRVFLHFESWGVSAYSCRWGRRVRLMPLHLWRRTLKKAHKECSPHPNGRIHDCTQELGLCQIKYNQYICEFFLHKTSKVHPKKPPSSLLLKLWRYNRRTLDGSVCNISGLTFILKGQFCWSFTFGHLTINQVIHWQKL